MPYITREDGEHLVIPSYRDVISAKQKNAIKKDVLALSQSYGEYITMQRKASLQYEVAFSPEIGFSLGESVWLHFNRPADMIFCETIPNSSEAILVIVKGESVYLDGSFSLESIPEELIIFLTQQNNFEIYTYGDVPISETSAEGKFSFDPGSVKSFTSLDEPVINTMQLAKAYQFQPVDQVLKTHGIGNIQTKQLAIVAVAFVAAWIIYSIATTEKKAPPPPKVVINPYQAYVDAMTSSPPDKSIEAFVQSLDLLYTAPGWQFNSVDYTNNNMSAGLTTQGSTIKALMQWCLEKGFSLSIKPTGITVSISQKVNPRPKPKLIYPSKEILAIFIDNLAKVYPGNNMTLSTITEPVPAPSADASDAAAQTMIVPYVATKIVITVTKITPIVLLMISQQLKDMPFTLDGISLKQSNELLSGTINLRALGT
jgi:hypothetical protein